MSHSVVGPSAAGTWVFCPGSVSMKKQVPRGGTSQSAEDGTAAHWAGSEALLGRGGSSFLGRQAPNGVIITEEMIDAAKVYVGHIRSIAVGTTSPLAVERKLAIKRIHALCFGTPDASFRCPTTGDLHIWDLKYGFGIVEAYENWQGICYAIGELDHRKLDDQTTRVHIHIVQPRASHPEGPIRTWTVLGRDLRSYGNRLEAAATAALGENPACVTGEHCRNCKYGDTPVLSQCPAAIRAGMSAVDFIGAAQPEILDNASEVGQYMALKQAVGVAELLLAAREGSLTAKIRGGQMVPGLALEAGKGRAGWTRPAAEVFALGDAMGVELRAEEKPLTPAQAKKAGLPAEIVSAFSAPGSTGLKLTLRDEAKTRRMFTEE